MNDSIEQLEYLYGELSANSLFLTHKLRQNEEILEQNIIKILNKLLKLVDSVEELNHLHYDVDKAIDDFEHIKILLEQLENILGI